MKCLVFTFITSMPVLFPCIVLSEEPIRKPRMDDTIRANIYADNAFRLYVNGELVAVDSIQFVPHNVVSVDILPAYPMTIAVMGIDNADSQTGMEYANTNIGDGGFILKLSDGTVTNMTWKAKKFSWDQSAETQKTHELKTFQSQKPGIPSTSMTVSGQMPRNTPKTKSDQRNRFLHTTSKGQNLFGPTT